MSFSTPCGKRKKNMAFECTRKKYNFDKVLTGYVCAYTARPKTDERDFTERFRFALLGNAPRVYRTEKRKYCSSFISRSVDNDEISREDKPRPGDLFFLHPSSTVARHIRINIHELLLRKNDQNVVCSRRHYNDRLVPHPTPGLVFSAEIFLL